MAVGNIYTVAGMHGQSGAATSGVPATMAKLNGPEGIFVDIHQNLFFVDVGNQVVREVAGPTPSAGMTAGDIYTIAGNASKGYAGDGGVAISASLAPTRPVPSLTPLDPFSSPTKAIRAFAKSLPPLPTTPPKPSVPGLAMAPFPSSTPRPLPLASSTRRPASRSTRRATWPSPMWASKASRA